MQGTRLCISLAKRGVRPACRRFSLRMLTPTKAGASSAQSKRFAKFGDETPALPRLGRG
jgi:hypothetical protein